MGWGFAQMSPQLPTASRTFPAHNFFRIQRVRLASNPCRAWPYALEFPYRDASIRESPDRRLPCQNMRVQALPEEKAVHPHAYGSLIKRYPGFINRLLILKIDSF
jgi:hypothetical protein